MAAILERMLRSLHSITLIVRLYPLLESDGKKRPGSN